MLSIILLFLSPIIFTATGELIEPECNYAATAAHYYPIDVCDSTRNNSVSTSFKYICNEDGEVEKYMYETFDCVGSPSDIDMNVTETELEHYKCDSVDCDYAIGCSFSKCANSNDTTCSKCAAETYQNNLENYFTHCFPSITGECIGDDLGLLLYDECENGLLTGKYFFDGSCDGNATWEEYYGGDDSATYCQGDKYYVVKCFQPSTTTYPITTNMDSTTTDIDPTTTDIDDITPEATGNKVFANIAMIFIATLFIFYN